MRQDGLPSDYGVEMYPGRLVWAVLALGAGTLLLSGLQWKIGTANRSEDDGSSILERSVTKRAASSLPIDVDVFESPLIQDDRRWKRSVRSDQRDSESPIGTSPVTVIYTGRPASTTSIDGDGGPSRRIFRANEDDGVPSGSSRQDQRPVITRVDARSSGPAVETWISEERKPKGLVGWEGPARPKKNDPRGTTDASLTLRNDRSEDDIVGAIETESRSGSAADQDRRVSRNNDVSRSARVSGSQEASINADNDLRSLLPRHTGDSEDDGHSGGTPATSASDEDAGEAGENSRSSPREQAKSNLDEILSLERKIAEGGARRYAAGMQEDQLLFFRDDRKRVQSSAMSPAEAIDDRKDLLGERDRNDPVRGRRGASRDWFTRASNRSQNFRRRAGGIATHETDGNGVRHERILEGSVKLRTSNTRIKGLEHSAVVNRVKRASSSNQYNETDARQDDARIDFAIDEEDELWNATKEDLSNNVDDVDLQDRIEIDEESSDGGNTFEIFDSVIPPDNKRRKVTRGEDSKDLMVASNFVWSSQDEWTKSKVLVPEDSRNRPIFSRYRPRRGSRGASTKKRTRSSAREVHESEADRRIDQERETALGDRRKRYANYYSAQSATPMAYVHIQPAFPAAPPMNRKCVRCMVVYKPCPSSSRPPPRIVLPSYRYHEPAVKWRGLKYGE